MKELIKKIRNKPHYVKLLDILVINGLLDIIEDELKDNKINYIDLVIKVINFLEKNKRYYLNFSSNRFDRIIILCIDEILSQKFKIDLDSEELESIIKLLRNNYLIRNFLNYIKDSFINLYYTIRCNKCKNSKEVFDSIEITQERDNI